MSTIEGGMVCTNDEEMYRILLSIRSHGWDRDFDKDYQSKIRGENDVNDFRALYTFYYPGFNLRSTDLQAFIGLSQIDKIETFSNKRNQNYFLYDKLIKNDYWKIKNMENCFYSNFAYPIITPNIQNLVKELLENCVECRPLVCGSIGQQPFWKKIYGEVRFDFADIVHHHGLYLPNNQDITEDEIRFISDIVNKSVIL
jgi:CDP-6-deoxy-D-xylo-4-hexulose-3-dehydrase